MREGSSDSRRHWFAAGALLAVHACLAWLARAPGVRTGEDEAIYLLLARDLLQGHYRNVFQVGQPPHGMYPPGYPTGLALWSLVGSGTDWLITLSVISSVIAIALVYDVCRRRFGAALGFTVLAALALNPYLVWAGGRLYSEALFVALSVGALWAMTWDSPRSPWLAGALAIAAALTRSAGVVLLPAIGLGFLLKRRAPPRRRIFTVSAFAAIAAGTVGLWQLHSVQQPNQYVGRSYVADFSEGSVTPARPGRSFQERLGRRIVNNSGFYVKEIPYDLPMPTIPGTPVDNVLGALVGIGAVAIGLVVLAGSWPSAVSYVLIYGALLAIWPWAIGRFITPMVPLLVLASLVGVFAVGNRLIPGAGMGAALVLGAILVVSGLLRTTSLVATMSQCQRGHSPPDASCLSARQAAFFRATEYLRDSASRNAVVLSGKPATVYYYAHRRGVQRTINALPPADSLLPFLRHNDVSYVLLGSVYVNEVTGLAPLLTANCRSLTVSNAAPPYAYVFEVASAPGDSSACRALRHYEAATRKGSFAVPP